MSIKFKAEDGHMLDSPAERIFDNALTKVGLVHQVHPAVPNSNFWADFKVGDVFVEIWGLSTDSYLQEKKRKLAHYVSKFLKLVELEEKNCYVPKRVFGKIEEIKKRKSKEQTTLKRKDSNENKNRDPSLLLWAIAGDIARENGDIAPLERRIGELTTEKDRLSKEIELIEDSLREEREKMNEVIRTYTLCD